ncbi:hypothetical protein D3C76_1786380 [compost metagenome]
MRMRGPKNTTRKGMASKGMILIRIRLIGIPLSSIMTIQEISRKVAFVIIVTPLEMASRTEVTSFMT